VTDLIEATRGFNAAASRLPRLFDITADEIELMDLLEDACNQDPPDPERVAALEAHLGDNHALIVQKTEHYVHVIEKFRMLKENHRARARERFELAAVCERSEELLKDRLRQALTAMGRKRVETPEGGVRRQLNNPSVAIIEEQAIPADFWTTPEPEVSKTKILDFWRATGGHSTPDGIEGGMMPAGVQIVRKESLRIS
jgi:hypothetical protein